jgi:hypothetical protein
MIRDIFGNPFRPMAINLAWITPAVSNPATAANKNRDLPPGTLQADRLAILADALEGAGCTDKAILDHLRRPGVHVRGCWALDAVLGKC